MSTSISASFKFPSLLLLSSSAGGCHWCCRSALESYSTASVATSRRSAGYVWNDVTSQAAVCMYIACYIGRHCRGRFYWRVNAKLKRFMTFWVCIFIKTVQHRYVGNRYIWNIKTANCLITTPIIYLRFPASLFQDLDECIRFLSSNNRTMCIA